ncbi:MAG TPA: M20 aminoacylase family protein [Zeimonas sp.]
MQGFPMHPTIERIAAGHDELRRWRRDLHAHPELGFEETRTSRLVAERLASFGVEVHAGVGRTGVVGVLRNGSSPRTIGLRADMDALPIAEANDFEHRSRHPNRMHACGHDGHATMLLAAARHLARTREFDGTVHFIFQPAEEGLGGAQAMLDDGLFERFPCESIFGMHNRPSLEVGRFAVRSGAMMAGGAFFDIDIEGIGTHGARPEAGVDPVMVAVQIASAAQTIVSRNVAPVQTAVLSITQIHAGDAYNVVPQRARLAGTARAFSKDTMQRIERRLREIAEGVAGAMGAKARFDFRVPFAPTINDPDEAEFAASVCAELVGGENVERDPPLIMASEDFSAMLERVPGCYLNIGNGGAAGGCEVHNPSYDFDDRALSYGAAFFVRAVERRLGAS